MRLIESLTYASRGLRHVFKNEPNFRLQTVAAGLVVAAIAYFPLKHWEIVVLLLLVLLVLVMEILNTAFERIADLLKPRLHHYVSVVKDLMAGAVLLTSLFAAVVGLVILIPYFNSLFK